MLGTVKEHIKQGFQWGAREGPLCDERKSNTCVRATTFLIFLLLLQQCVMSNSVFWMQASRKSQFSEEADKLSPQHVVSVTPLS